MTDVETMNAASSAPRKRIDVSRLLLAALLIAVTILSGVAVYQQQQISILAHQISADTVVVGGTRYY